MGSVGNIGHNAVGPSIWPQCEKVGIKVKRKKRKGLT